MGSNTEGTQSRSWLSRIGGIAVVIVAIVGWKMWNKSSESDDAAEAIRGWVVSCSEYPKEKDYIDGLLTKHHEAAFGESYTTRRRGSRFDTDKYVSTLFSGMIQQARSEQKPAVADSLQVVWNEYQKAK